MAVILIQRIGFSMGISDCIATKEGYDKVKNAISEALIKCEMINSVPNKDPGDREREINGVLNEAMSVAPKLAKTAMNKNDRNSLVIMKKSGAKGNDTNNGQITGLVGAQNLDGKRMALMLSGNTRALPHFLPGDNSPAARGFVQHSYFDGLTFQEAWFHFIAGRRGVVDTAMKSVTGDTQILIKEAKKCEIKMIGPWIDDFMKNSDKVKKIECDGLKMEIIELEQNIKIPTCDSHGNVSWGLVTHITRHDPTEKMFHIRTQSKRCVSVTDSKSLLIWNPNKKEFEQTLMRNVKIGDFVPVSETYDAEIYGDFPYETGEWCFVTEDKIRDVYLDPITEISEYVPLLNTYVYDLTVPSTTNFGLANGLHVVDTADSGYVQKKMVKKIEDCKVHHDGSVRDANGVIIQYIYGGDGFSAKEMIPAKGIDYPFFINPASIAELLNTEAEDRKETGEGPKNLGALRKLRKEEIDLLVSHIQAGAPGIQTEVTERATFNIRTNLRVCMYDVKVYELMIPTFCARIYEEFEQSKAKMGYMAGQVSASSLGEPTTQLSIQKDERIPFMIKFDNKSYHYNDKIEDMVNYILKNFCKIIWNGEITDGGESIVGIISKNVKVYVNTVNPISHKCEWKILHEVSKHPANGKLVAITTKSGRKIITTLSHSHLYRSESGEILPIRGDQLKVGSFIPVCSNINLTPSIKENSN